MKKLFLVCVAFGLWACSGSSGSSPADISNCANLKLCHVNLTWDKVTKDISGVALSVTPHYRLYWGLGPADYGHFVDTGESTQGTISGLGSGTYYFSVVAYNPVTLAASPHSSTVSQTNWVNEFGFSETDGQFEILPNSQKVMN